MPADFVTIATYDTPPPAHLALGLLREEGIDAMLRNENIVAGAWDLGQASRGVEVRVPRADAQRAFDLVEQAAFGGGVPAQEELAAQAGAPGPEDFDDLDDPPEPTPEEALDREMADRARRAAAFGFLFAPLQLYSLWLLYSLSRRLPASRATPEIRTRMRQALLMDGFVIAIVLLMVISLARTVLAG